MSDELRELKELQMTGEHRQRKGRMATWTLVIGLICFAINLGLALILNDTLSIVVSAFFSGIAVGSALVRLNQ